mgnify:CR=1 FL=1
MSFRLSNAHAVAPSVKEHLPATHTTVHWCRDMEVCARNMFEMKYFCNSKLEALKDLYQYVNKNLSFGGIITNVQHRIAKNGKGWGSFMLEGYDESFEFRIFGEDYLKFRHFLIQNNFTYLKVLIKDGWLNQEGKKGEPRMQFQLVQYLQDVLPSFAKKLIIRLDIMDLQQHLIQKLNDIFKVNKGDNQVSFEVMEIETVKKQLDIEPPITIAEAPQMDSETEMILDEALEIVLPETADEIKIITSVTLPSRKLKIKISNELLQELEKMQINFKLN